MAGHVFFRFLVLSCGLAGLAGCADAPSAVTASVPAAPLSTQTLMGSTPQLLNADFGPPALRRVDVQAQVWVYQSAVCGLQVFLYPDAAGTPRVAAALPDSADPASCMQSFTHSMTSAALALERPASS
jgi:hypothetical protein